MRYLKLLYLIIFGILWMMWLVIIYPIYGILLLIKPTHRFCHYVNVYYWSTLIFIGGLLPWSRVGYRKNVKKGQPYIVCANHSSYLDIPLMFRTFRRNFTIIGKAELNKVPFFGFMFKTLYIAVDRSSRESRFNSFKRSLQAIDSGKSVVFFPEGTIPKKVGYEMIRFQEGAFRLAIQKKVPILPVTLPYNWIIMHDNGSKTGMRWHRMLAVYHEPIETKDLTLDDLDDLKQKVFDIISTELKKRNKGK